MEKERNILKGGHEISRHMIETELELHKEGKQTIYTDLANLADNLPKIKQPKEVKSIIKHADLWANTRDMIFGKETIRGVISNFWFWIIGFIVLSIIGLISLMITI